MIEIRIHGRGGQGGVTLAKILATSQHLEGKSVQAFGIYAAERSGAPLQAFIRFDDQPILNRNQIYEPDHVILLDPTLVSPAITSGLKPGGFILINTPEPLETFAKQDQFKGYRVAVVDATSIARKNKLGTKTVPIVNTALAGATAKILQLRLQAVLDAFEEMGFHGGNAEAAKETYEKVSVQGNAPEKIESPEVNIPTARVPGMIEGNVGALPAIKTGNWAVQQPGQKTSTPPCNFICPAGNDVQGFLAALANDHVDEALGVLARTTPFPSVCGRVCPGFCMMQCNRATVDGPVNVRALERYAGDHGNHQPKPQKKRKESVAVIGSGPAGLSGAYQLALLGYQVTVFESEEELGGLMRTGIPAYRLPRESLDKDIDRILNLGVKTELKHKVSREEMAELKDKFDGVMVATGLQKNVDLDLGEDMRSVMQGIEFLNWARKGGIRVEDEDIVVIGGGNTAIDAARSAFRLGARSVKILYRRTREEMPAIDEEVDDAIDEGIQVDFLRSPKRIVKSDKRMRLVCQRMELGEPDDSGRRRPVVVENSDYDVFCDRVVLALGQYRDLSLFPEDVELVKDHAVGGELGETTYAAGDLLTNEGTVTAAIGCGRDMAFRLHEHFTGEKLYDPPKIEENVVRLEQIKSQHFPHEETHRENPIPFSDRKNSFEEVRQGLSSAEEAQRCFSCGVCNNCDRCVTYCPDGVIKRVGDELVFDYEYCKGCGVCVAECSRSVVYMKPLAKSGV